MQVPTNNKTSSLLNKIKLYISCKSCKCIVNVQEKSNNNDNYDEQIILPPSETHNLEILSLDGAWYLVCQTCKENIGNIKDGSLSLSKSKVDIVTIEYLATSPSQKPNLKENRNIEILKLYHYAETYLSKSFANLSAKLTRIESLQSNREKLYKDIQGFTCFYNKHFKKFIKNKVSSHESYN